MRPKLSDALLRPAKRATPATGATTPPEDPFRHWFKARGWKPFPYQLETWKAFRENKSGLIHAPTGVGKTYSVWIPALQRWWAEPANRASEDAPPIQVIWITPLRALANDTVNAMLKPVEDLELPWSVELRTGDTSAATRARQRKVFPSALVTTPESLSLLLSYPDTRTKLQSLRTVVVDEWHELLGSKRGVQTELCLARLRAWLPQLQTWGLSATLGNLDQALQVLVGTLHQNAVIIAADVRKKTIVETLLPKSVDRFPWAGHVGLRLLPQVIRKLQRARSTLLFTNTRSQTEIWFRALQEARPDWSHDIALHHGSISRELREAVEARLREGKIRCVVCTSSLDLGVDFPPVDQVIQVGAPKGVARMLQRAGRSGHRMGGVSRIVCVPAHALELVEFAAVREAIGRGQLEKREPLDRPFDVLAQHLVTLGLGGGFDARALRKEVQSAYSYRHLTDEEWQWCMDFVTRGGQALGAYPQFKRVVEREGAFVVEGPQLARLHRMSIGTITSDSSVLIRFLQGGTLGSTEESFIARIRPGQRFSFAGHALELVRVHDLVAYVRRTKKPAGAVPQWMGGRMPLSSQLAEAVRGKLREAADNVYEGREMKAARPVLELQGRWSRIPTPRQLLVERTAQRDGTHHFVFPFAGRLVHEGLAALIAHRITQIAPATLSVTANDYGFGLLGNAPVPFAREAWAQILSPDNLLEDLIACLNSAELAKRQFREIARVAGLVFQGYPGQPKTTRQLQASSGLFYDVFARYDPHNLLLHQARREVLERQLEVKRMQQVLEQIAGLEIELVETERLTPLSFPLWAAFVQASVSTEKWTDRIARMAEQLEAAAQKEVRT